MRLAIRVVGESGAERYLALRIVERTEADWFMHAEVAWDVADAVKQALGQVYVDVIDLEDEENRVSL